MSDAIEPPFDCLIASTRRTTTPTTVFSPIFNGRTCDPPSDQHTESDRRSIPADARST
jgi:hypothetical protein